MPLVTFEEPGPRRGAPALPIAVLGLREVARRPLTWARVASYGSSASASSFVSRLRRRVAESPPEDCGDGRFDFTVRSRRDGTTDVFAIFLPDEAV